MGTEDTISACSKKCIRDSNCQAFTFCAANGGEPSVGNCPKGASCWLFNSTSRCHAGNKSFTSGFRANTIVWTGFKNATLSQSDSFSLYPLWPSETVDAVDSHAVDAKTRNISAASVKQYADPSGRPVLVFMAAVRGGNNPDIGRSPDEIVSGLNAMLASKEGPCPGRSNHYG